MLEKSNEFEVSEDGYRDMLDSLLRFFNSRYLVTRKKLSDGLSDRYEEIWEFSTNQDPEPIGWITDERENFYEAPDTPQMLRITVHDTDQSEEIVKFLEAEIGVPSIRGSSGTLYWGVRPV